METIVNNSKMGTGMGRIKWKFVHQHVELVLPFLASTTITLPYLNP